ncbi:BQ2448_4358 [Microbotryum intermedium]|uniref:BQ2448_4358 protein n=1 Tax=Microbotryum intermedium TaxID=269621 RepID=A0A238FKZ7_9BASI|nr:BQ2448_4358 [Microbotryum intermedium]
MTRSVIPKYAEIDAFEQKLFLDGETQGLRHLYDLEFGGLAPPSVLSAADALPQPMKSSFEAHPKTLRRLWKLASEIREDIENVRTTSGNYKYTEYNATIVVANVQNTFLSGVMHELYERMLDRGSTAKSSYPLSSTSRLSAVTKQPHALLMPAEDEVLDRTRSPTPRSHRSPFQL